MPDDSTSASGRLDAETKFLRKEDRLEFVDLLVHDLKSPVSNFLAALRHLERQHGSLGEEARGELIASARRSGERVMTYIRDFLDSRLLESGRLKARLVPERLITVIEGAAEAARHVAAERGLTIAVKCGAEFHQATDAKLLSRVLDNLISNAVKYSAAQTTIELTARAEGEGWLLEVANDGREIPPEFQEGIFLPFKALQDKSATVSRPGVGSTGLGLYFCKQGVRALGGRFEYDFDGGRNYLRCRFEPRRTAADTP